MAMFGWTELYGTSHTALRLPSAIVGALSVLMLGLIGRREFGPRIAILAAVLLALHGFHLFWSQSARMYTSGVFLGLISTWILLQLADAKQPKRLLEFSYVVIVFAGIQTVELFWPFLLLQVG